MRRPDFIKKIPENRISYLLHDSFLTDKATGSVNGTAPEPGPGTRTVVDPTSKLSLSSGLAVFADSGGAWQRPTLQYDTITRVAGRLVVFNGVNFSSQSNTAIGYNGGSDGAGQMTIGVNINGDQIILYNSSYDGTIAPFSNGVNYSLCYIYRTNGGFYFDKSTGYFNLLFIYPTGNDNRKPTIINHSSAFVVGSVKVPALLWLPTPLASDGFSFAGITDGLGHAEGIAGELGKGGSGLIWSSGGSTWTVSGGKAINTPTIGNNVVVNGGFNADTDWTKGTGFTISGGKAVYSTADGTPASLTAQVVNLDMKKFYKIVYDVDAISGTYAGVQEATAGTPINYTSGTKTAYQRNLYWDRSHLRSWSNGGVTTCTLDNFAEYELTTSELFNTINFSTPDAIISADMYNASNLNIGYSADSGLVTNLDSVSNPQNFIYSYLRMVGGTGPNYISTFECVAGSYTQKGGTAIVYSAGQTFVIARNGTSTRVYYNNGAVGSAMTMTANTNTRHGLYSTDSGNPTHDNFTCYARGTSNEYSYLDKFTT